MSGSRAIVLAFTGASGAPYGLRLLECLIGAGRRVHLMFSKPALIVIKTETDLAMPGRASDQQCFLSDRFGAVDGQLQVFGNEEWTSPVASGSSLHDGMVVCPCTTGTLCSIAAGTSRNLIERAADVALKERRPLILVPRETPLSAVHLGAMLKLAQAGAVILPPNPGFYHRPDTVDQMVDFVVGRILDHLGIDHSLVPRWGEGDIET